MVTAQKPFYTKIQKNAVHQSLINILPSFDSLDENKKKFLVNLWLKSYEYGLRIVKKDSFTNTNLITCQEIKDRFDQYSEVKANNLAFIKRIAENDEKTLELILAESANQSDFVYETYESNYIDKSLDVLNTISTPKGYEKIDLSLASQDGFAEGVMIKIDYLAKNALTQMAINKIKDM